MGKFQSSNWWNLKKITQIYMKKKKEPFLPFQNSGGYLIKLFQLKTHYNCTATFCQLTANTRSVQ